MSLDREHQHILLRDGRRLGFAEYGDAIGEPVFFFHGWPNSRLEAGFGDRAAARQGYRLVGVDRPGFGLSQDYLGRRILDWPGDVIQLAHRLGITSFAVLGLSGGTPYALACAYLIPGRLTRVTIVSGIAPPDAGEISLAMPVYIRLFFRAVRRAPRISGFLLRREAELRLRRPQRFINRLRRASGPDGRLYQDTGIAHLRLKTLLEGARSGADGWLHDAQVLGSPWGFSLGEIDADVDLWHGEEDRMVGSRVGHALAQGLPNCRPRFIRGEGHVSVLVNQIDAILLNHRNDGDYPDGSSS